MLEVLRLSLGLCWLVFELYVSAALQQSHLLDSSGHSRQSSDSSVERFLCREDAPEASKLENKVSV